MSDVGCVRVRCPASVEPAIVADRCWALGATAIGEPAVDGAALEVGFASEVDADLAAAALTAAWPDLGVEVVDAGPALEAALDAWKAHARPVRVGRLHVRPAWLDDDDEPPGPDEVPVVVDPSRAFGYDHPSTLLCLAEIERRIGGPGASVLDVGCGSGVLANIGAATLVALAPAIAGRVGPGGCLVLAGLLAEQVRDVVAVYEGEGLDLREVGERSGWATPVFLRKSTF